MSRTPKKLAGSRAYREAWRAVNLLIRSDGSWSGRERDVCYRNLGDGSFADTSFVTGLDSAGDGRGFVVLDLNGDGALDLVEASRTAPRIRVLENSVGAEAGLVLELRGRSQPDAIGAMAELTTASGRKLVRLVEAGAGYLTQSSRRLHFALPRGEKADRLRIRWPDGAEQVVTSVPERGTHRFTQGAESFESIDARPIVARASAAPENAASVWLVEPVPAPAMKGVTAGRSKTLVNFWASWCPPCREEMKEWSSPGAARRLAASGVRVVVASVDEDAQQRPAGAPFTVVRPSAEELAAWNLFHRHLFDRRREIGLPTSFLLDERGQVVTVYQGVTASAQIASDALLAPAARRSFPFAGIWLGERPRRNFTELATALAEGGLSKESARYFELAIARGGKSSRETMNNYAGVLLESGEFTKAETMLQPLLAGASQEDDVLANLGTLRLRQGRNEEARAAFEKLLANSPDDAMALNGLGSALFALQDLESAKARLAAAVQVDPDHAGYRYNWASALAASGEFRAALREFEVVRERQGESAALANNLGILYVETGEAAQGEAEFRKAMTLAPRDAGGYLNLATLYQKTNRAAQARDILRELLKAVPGQPQALRMLGDR